MTSRAELEQQLAFAEKMFISASIHNEAYWALLAEELKWQLRKLDA